MNFLFCSVGRRAELLKNFRKTMGNNGRIVATDITDTAPALYFADKYYIVPPISSPDYLDIILDICKKEDIQVVTTCIDPEIMLLAQHRDAFEKEGVQVLAPYEESARLCYDKFQMYRFLVEHGVATMKTYGDICSFEQALQEGRIDFPVFVKPRTGSGSVGARVIDSLQVLREAVHEDESLIIQEYMGSAIDMDADIYFDTVSHNPVSIFTKRKLATRIGGASKTVSFKDEKLVEFLLDALRHFAFNGPIDVDVFYRDGQYYLSEINPRFGGAYLHAYGAGVDFFEMIHKNVMGIANAPAFFEYEDDVAMLMYDSVVICKLKSKCT